MSTLIKNPFKFLDSFTKEDKDLYFGRDQEIEALYELLSQTDLVLLYGETGTGKTSLVNCGLAKKFDETDWLPVYIRRNQNINDAIRTSLLEYLEPEDTPSTAASIQDIMQAVYWRHLRPIYLIFDQLEELFILGNQEEQQQFIEDIQQVLEERVETKAILIFREEYLAHLNYFEAVIPTLFDKRLRIEAMRAGRAAEVITLTCTAAGIRLASEDIPNQIVDIITEEGRASVNLPYLQVFLNKLFKKAAAKEEEEIVFDQDLIREVGSLGNVLTRFLEDQVAAAADEVGSGSMVWLFLKFFVTPDGTKKPVSRTEIFDSLGKLMQQREKLNFCLNYFTNSHILRPLEKEQYELTHDSIAVKIHRARLRERNLVPLIEGNPYKGLAPYDQQDSSIFFGRDKVIREVYRKIANQSLIVITGASGAGKSSLVKAGLLPKLQAEGYRITLMLRPGNHPQDNLDAVLQNMRSGTPPGKGFVLVIDQYEELITRTEKDEERDAFIDQLRRLIERPEELLPELGNKKVKIIITVRADFEPQFEQLGLREYWYEAKYVIPLLSRSELIEVIERPAYLAACHFEPEELIDRMVDEVLGGAGSLPLLSFALSLLYERCRHTGRIISEETYREIGGVIGSLKTHADEIYQSLEPEKKRTMERLMLRMVSLEGAELASRRAYLHELEFEDAAENKRVGDVLDLLTENRLIISGVDPASNNLPFVEPAHDALIWGWGTLWDWIKAFGKDKLILQQQVREQVKLYQESKGDKRYLWHNDPRLEQVSNDDWPNRDERAFIQAGIKLKSRRRTFLTALLIGSITVLLAFAFYSNLQRNAAINSQQETEAVLDTLRSLQEELRTTQRENALAEYQRLLVEGQAATQAANFLEAINHYQNALAYVRNMNDFQINIDSNGATARNRLQEVTKSYDVSDLFYRLMIQGDSAVARGARYYVDARKHYSEALNLGFNDNWAQGKLFGLEGKLEIAFDQFKRTGDRFYATDNAVGYANALVNYREANRIKPADPYIRQRIQDIQEKGFAENSGSGISGGFFAGGPCFVQFMNQGRRLEERGDYDAAIAQYSAAAICSDRSATEQRLAQEAIKNAQERRLRQVSEALEVAQLERQRAAEQAQLAFKSAQIAEASRLAFVANQQLEAGNRKDALLLALYSRKLTDGEAVPSILRTFGEAAFEYFKIRLPGHQQGALAARFAVDNSNLITVDQTNQIRLWDLNKIKLIREITTDAKVLDIALILDEQWLAAGMETGKIILWNLVNKSTYDFMAHKNAISGLRLSPDRSSLLSWSRDGSLGLWDLSGTLIARLDNGQNIPIMDAQFSPSGDAILARYGNANVDLWTSEGQLLAKLPHTQYVYQAQFSPDGRSILTASADGTAKLWDRSGALLNVMRGHQSVVFDAQFSPDGSLIATASEDGKTRIWDLRSQLVAEFPGGDGRLLRWFADGEMLITVANTNKTARIWTRQGTPVSELSGHIEKIWGLDISPDGQSILTYSLSGTTILYNLQGDQLLRFTTRAKELMVEAGFSPDGRHFYLVPNGAEVIISGVPDRVYEELLRNEEQWQLTEEMKKRYDIQF